MSPNISVEGPSLNGYFWGDAPDFPAMISPHEIAWTPFHTRPYFYLYKVVMNGKVGGGGIQQGRHPPPNSFITENTIAATLLNDTITPSSGLRRPPCPPSPLFTSLSFPPERPCDRHLTSREAAEAPPFTLVDCTTRRKRSNLPGNTDYYLWKMGLIPPSPTPSRKENALPSLKQSHHPPPSPLTHDS